MWPTIIRNVAWAQTVGNTSCNMYMEARSFNVYTHEEDTILSTNITFVRIDEDGNPIPISDKVRNEFTIERRKRGRKRQKSVRKHMEIQNKREYIKIEKEIQRIRK